MSVKFNTTPREKGLIVAIADRYFARFPNADLVESQMDFAACHCNGNPLDLEALLAADDTNFLHDVCGIRTSIDRTTGKLGNHFSPRFSL